MGTATRVAASLRHVRTLPAVAFLSRAETRRKAKLIADRVLLFVTVCTLVWAVTGVAFVEKWSMIKRSTIAVHLPGGPAVTFANLDGTRFQPAADTLGSTTPAAARLAAEPTLTVIVSITVVNDGPRPVTISSADLSGPFLTGDPTLVADAGGAVAAGYASHVRGSITVQCAAASSVVADAAESVALPGQAPTVLGLTVVTANHVSHRVDLTIDTTAYAVQGRACS
jgi:hypothetical protein